MSQPKNSFTFITISKMNQQNNKNTKHISLLLLTKNETENINKNFNWLKTCPVINEIIIVDDYSTDQTRTLLKNLTRPNLKIKIFKRRLNGDFSQQRIFALSKTTNNWVLWLDADEKPTPDLINFLNNLNFESANSFAFKRTDIFLNHQLRYGETAHQHFTRLFDKRYGLFERPVHETWISRQPIVKTNFHILHYSHPNLQSFLKKINFYTDIRACELHRQNVSANIFQIIFFPLVKFIQNYIIRLGFLDSTPGIIMALSMSLHSFLVRAKLWQRQH